MARQRSWVPRRRYAIDPVGDDPFDDEWLDEDEAVMPPPAPSVPPPSPRDWKRHVALVGESMRPALAGADLPVREREILYLVDVNPDRAQHGLTIEVSCRARRASGAWSARRPLRLQEHEIAALPDPADQKILSLLAAAPDDYGSWLPHRSSWDVFPPRRRLPPAIQDVLLAMMCRTGRCHIQPETPAGELPPLVWDEGEPWRFRMDVAPDSTGRAYVVSGSLCRADERMAIEAPLLLLGSGLLFTQERVARLDHGGAFAWVAHLRRHGTLHAPAAQGPALVEAVLRPPEVPPLDLPSELRFDDVTMREDPDCRLFLVSLKAGGLGLNLTAAEYVFLLDPWWNPAVEAQAIDRTHRIGQTRAVFAYRLIARDTVEEKVLALQETKRELADAIITEDNSLIGTLTREDLERLLS